MLLQDYFHHHAKVVLSAWPDQYHHDHNWNGRLLFGTGWMMWICCFFPVLHVLLLGSGVRGPTWLTNSRFLLKCDFCLGTSRECQETESRFTERIRTMRNIDVSDRGKLFFYAIVHFIPLQLQLRAPLFAQNRFVMYITRLHRYVCYVCHALFI